MVKQKKDNLHIVEKILDKSWRTFEGKKELYYLCKWRGFSSNDATYEPVYHLIGCEDLIAQYERTEKEKKAKKAKQTKKRKESEESVENFTRKGSLRFYDLPQEILLSTQRKGIRMFLVKWENPEGTVLQNTFVTYEKLVETHCTLVYNNYMKKVQEEYLRKQK